MKRFLLFILTLIAASVLVAGNCQHGAAGSQAKKDDCGAWMKDAKFDVINLDNGAKMTITAEKAETVKAVQEHFAGMGKDCPHHDAAWHKDAKIEVVNQPNGVLVTLTTAQADQVKPLQEHFAKMGKGDCCKGMKDGKGCKHGQEKAEVGCKHGQEKKVEAATKCPHAEAKAGQPNI